MTALEMLAERISAGDSVTQADARILMESRDLISVGMIADEFRRRLHGVKTTFVRVFEVHVDAVPTSLPSALSAGEIRIAGQPESLDEARAVVSSLRKLAGATPLTGFSPFTLAVLRVPLRDVSRQLAEAGLDAVAEVPVDQLTDAGVISELREGGLHVYRMTVEAYGDRPSTELLQRASDIQTSVGGFRAFAPLPRVLSPVTPTTGYDDVKLVATARVLVGNIPSIQVDWPLYGPKLAQVALTMGADDVDGIAAHDPGILGGRRTALAEIQGNIRAAAQEPVERNGRFQVE